MAVIAGEKRAVMTVVRPVEVPAGGESAEKQEPTLRLHIWLETGDGIFFGAGRALLLAKIEEYGSLRKAAEDIGMSYRAAWGKIKKTEKLLGVRLIVQNGSRKEGHRLTEFGTMLKNKYFRWFNEIEKEALRKAQEIFPWAVKCFTEESSKKILQCLLAVSLSLSPLDAGSFVPLGDLIECVH